MIYFTTGVLMASFTTDASSVVLGGLFLPSSVSMCLLSPLMCWWLFFHWCFQYCFQGPQSLPKVLLIASFRQLVHPVLFQGGHFPHQCVDNLIASFTQVVDPVLFQGVHPSHWCVDVFFHHLCFSVVPR